jgi:hypothetical protein
MSNSDIAVFLIVIGLRLIVPLFIPKFPLPAVILAMLIDAADQTIYQKFTDAPLTKYQGYDKALDVYYLSIAYLATMRNWTNLDAFNVSRFLLYYRFVGVLLFEATQTRWLLMLFPNTFEYFFIWYEAVRLRWNPIRMSRKLVVGAAAFIWIFIKLPQEYWIHVAQLDFTETVENHPWFGVLCVVGVIVIFVIGWYVITKKCPPADHKPNLVMEQAPAAFAGGQTVNYWQRIIDNTVLEKIALISLISSIFALILPDVEASSWTVVVAVAFVIASNTVVSELLSRRGIGDWSGAIRNFLAVGAINAGVVIVALILLPNHDDSINLGNAVIFLFLLTLIVTLYDRYHPIYLARLAEHTKSETDALPATA